MRSTTKKAKISLAFKDMNASELVTFAGGTVEGLTGNADLPHPTIDLGDITTQVGDLDATNKKISGGDVTSTTQRLMEQQANILMMWLTTNAHYTEDTANATAAGNLARVEEIILSSGYKLKKKIRQHQRTFEVVETGVGWFHSRVPKAAPKKQEAHLWRFGSTIAKDVIPEKLTTRYCLEADVIITDIESNTIIGIQHSSILPALQSGKTLSSTSQTGKSTTLLPASKSNHPMFSYTADDPYLWSDFIYIVIP
jgi:hypothetical protein